MVRFFLCGEVEDSVGQAAEEDVVGAGEGVGREITGKGGIVKLRLESVVVMFHGLFEGFWKVVGEKVGFPIENEVVVLMGKDKINETFDIVVLVGIKKFYFGMEMIGMDVA